MFQFSPTEIPDVIEIKPAVLRDARGFFFEAYRESEFKENGISDTFVQENESQSHRGTLRGLHYQLSPHAQSKLVRCLSGTIFDVAVDIRPGSPSYGKWVGRVLSDSEHNALYVPVGFAHGFYVISDSATILYKCGNYYHKPAERCIRWDDPTLAIAWPIQDPSQLILSEKDQAADRFGAHS